MAVPRTSVEPPRTDIQPKEKEGLSVQTLLIAALASGIAAIVVSRFWESGTIFASAMTPVVVAVASELLRKPVESERLRSGVRSVSSSASFARPRSGRTPSVMAPPTPGVDEGLRRREEGVEPGPVRVYSSGTNKRPRAISDSNGRSPRRRLHLKVAVVTGLIAFLIAAVVLTLPELIFGSSVTGGGRNTTVFGGGSDTEKKTDSKDSESTDGQSDEPTQQDSGSDSTDGSGDEPAAPSGEQPETTAPESEPTPEEQAPAPAPTPAPQTPAPAPSPSP